MGSNPVNLRFDPIAYLCSWKQMPVALKVDPMGLRPRSKINMRFAEPCFWEIEGMVKVNGVSASRATLPL